MHLASFATYQLLLVNLNITACVSNVFTQHHPPLDNDMIRIDRSRKLLPRHTSVQSNYRALQSNHTGGLSWNVAATVARIEHGSTLFPASYTFESTWQSAWRALAAAPVNGLLSSAALRGQLALAYVYN